MQCSSVLQTKDYSLFLTAAMPTIIFTLCDLQSNMYWRKESGKISVERRADFPISAAGVYKAHIINN